MSNQRAQLDPKKEAKGRVREGGKKEKDVIRCPSASDLETLRISSMIVSKGDQYKTTIFDAQHKISKYQTEEM